MPRIRYYPLERAQEAKSRTSTTLSRNTLLRTLRDNSDLTNYCSSNLQATRTNKLYLYSKLE